MNNEVQYSGGTGGGRCLKLAVKLPNRLTSKLDDISFAPKNLID
ncbi:MAG: hypothetical protein WA421_15500 [Nitrososphaeraceae archaeon]